MKDRDGLFFERPPQYEKDIRKNDSPVTWSHPEFSKDVTMDLNNCIKFFDHESLGVTGVQTQMQSNVSICIEY